MFSVTVSRLALEQQDNHHPRSAPVRLLHLDDSAGREEEQLGRSTGPVREEYRTYN